MRYCTPFIIKPGAHFESPEILLERHRPGKAGREQTIAAALQ
jgi:hypothetical protein